MAFCSLGRKFGNGVGIIIFLVHCARSGAHAKSHHLELAGNGSVHAVFAIVHQQKHSKDRKRNVDKMNVQRLSAHLNFNVGTLLYSSKGYKRRATKPAIIALFATDPPHGKVLERSADKVAEHGENMVDKSAHQQKERPISKYCQNSPMKTAFNKSTKVCMQHISKRLKIEARKDDGERYENNTTDTGENQNFPFCFIGKLFSFHTVRSFHSYITVTYALSDSAFSKSASNSSANIIS